MRQKVLNLDTERVLRQELAFSSSDEESFESDDTPTASEARELDAETVILETLKIRDTVGIQSLCEAAWTSIVNYGV